MKKFLILFFILIVVTGCSKEPEKPKPGFSFTMSTYLKDQSRISFKATIITNSEKRKEYLEKRVERIKQALEMKLKVLITKQVKDERKVAKLVKIILEGRKGKDLEIEITDFVLKKS